MLKISQNFGKFANQFSHTNQYHYLTSRILSQARCGPVIDTTTRTTQASTNEANTCGCAIRINQRVGLCQLGRNNNDNNSGDAPLKSSCLWVVDKATPWFTEQRNKWNFHNKLSSLSDRCKILGITSTTEAAKAQMISMKKPIMEAQQLRLDPSKFKHISPEFLALLREHDNYCLQKNPFYGLPPPEKVSRRRGSRSPANSPVSRQRSTSRDTVKCRDRTPCTRSCYRRRQSSYKQAKKPEPCEPFDRGDPHMSAYKRARKAGQFKPKGYSNEVRASRKDRYAEERMRRAASKLSGFFRHSYNSGSRGSSRSLDQSCTSSGTGFHRHPLEHLRTLDRCDHATPYFNKRSRSCSSLRKQRGSSQRTASQNLGFHRRIYQQDVKSSKLNTSQPGGGVNRFWDYGGAESQNQQEEMLAKGFYRHTYDSTSPIRRSSRSRSRSRSRSGSRSQLNSESSPPCRPYESPYRDPFRYSQSRSLICRKMGRHNQPPVRQIYMKPKAAEMRESQSRCCLSRRNNRERDRERDSNERCNRNRFGKDQCSSDGISNDECSNENVEKKKRNKKEEYLANCCQELPKTKRKKRQPQVKFNKRQNKYYNEPTVHGYKDSLEYDSSSKRDWKRRYDNGSDGSTGSYKDNDRSRRRSSDRSRKRSEDASGKQGKQKESDRDKNNDGRKSKNAAGAAAVAGGGWAVEKKRSSDVNVQTDQHVRYPPLRASKTQKQRMMKEALNRFTPQPEENDEAAMDGKNANAKKVDGKRRGFMAKLCCKRSKSNGAEADAESGSNDSPSNRRKRSHSSISINDTSSKSGDSLGPYADKWPSRTASVAPRLPLASKKCGRRLVRDPAVPPKPKMLRKRKSWCNCRSSESPQATCSSDMTFAEYHRNVAIARQREIRQCELEERQSVLLRLEREANTPQWPSRRRRRETPLLVGVAPDHHICHMDSHDWTTVTRHYPRRLRQAGMEQRCEANVNCQHRCTTVNLLNSDVSDSERKRRQHRHNLCRRDSHDWKYAKANYPLSYQMARCAARADAAMLRCHRANNEKILNYGYTPHKQAVESKAKRMQRQQQEQAEPKCKSKPKASAPRPDLYAPKPDFSQKFEALHRHEKCLPRMQRIHLLRQQQEQAVACKRSEAELKKKDEKAEQRRHSRRAPYDPGDEYEQRTLRDEEKQRSKEHKQRSSSYFMGETDDEYYQEAEEEERKRKSKLKTKSKSKPKPCPRWEGRKQSVTIVCTPDSKDAHLKRRRPIPPPKPPKKYGYDDRDDDEYRRLKRLRRSGELQWFDEADTRAVMRCVNKRAEMRCVLHEPRPPAPCLAKPAYILGQPKPNRK